MIPLRSSDPGDLAALRQLLSQHGFTEDTVARLMGLPTVFGISVERRETVSVPADGLETLLQLFVEGRSLEEGVLAATLGGPGAALLSKIGLIVPDSEARNCVVAACALYPVRGLWLASDRWNVPVGRAPKPLPPDSVFPGVTKLTRDYLAMLPETPCQDFLELCSGSGITALDAAHRYAGRSYGVDITPRSCEYARWSAALNELKNVEIAEGDTYGPLINCQFDRVAVHPPYVPALKTARIYADGGADGEHVTRGAIEGLPRVLRPGGRFYCDALVTDRGERPWEVRVREILGEAADDFDVAVFQRMRMEREEFLRLRVAHRENTVEEAQELLRMFEQLGATHFVHAVTVVQRRNQARPVFTIRRIFAPSSESAEVEWLMDRRTKLAEPETRHRAESLPLQVEPGAQMRVDYGMTNGDWQVTEAQLRIAFPFPYDFQMPDWAARMVALCQGNVSANDLWAGVQQTEQLPDFLRDRFLELIWMLIGGGFITPAGWAPTPSAPPAAERPETSE